MVHWIWMIVNTIFILGTAIYIWLFHPHPSAVIRSGQFFAQTAILFFVVNLNMYFILLVIRKSKRNSVRFTLAKLARILMKWHIRIAIAGTALIIIHAGVMMTQISPYIGFLHIKMVSGYAAMLWLGVTLFAGYLRSRRASGFRRRFHLTMAFIFGALFIAHIFVR